MELAKSRTMLLILHEYLDGHGKCTKPHKAQMCHQLQLECLFPGQMWSWNAQFAVFLLRKVESSSSGCRNVRWLKWATTNHEWGEVICPFCRLGLLPVSAWEECSARGTAQPSWIIQETMPPDLCNTQCSRWPCFLGKGYPQMATTSCYSWVKSCPICS